MGELVMTLRPNILLVGHVEEASYDFSFIQPNRCPCCARDRADTQWPLSGVGPWTVLRRQGENKTTRRGWMDHTYRLLERNGMYVYYAEPYWVKEAALLDFQLLRNAGWTVSIGGLPRHHPATVPITMHPPGFYDEHYNMVNDPLGTPPPVTEEFESF